MKKFIIVLCGVLLSSALFAQFDLGIRVGANYRYLGIEDYQIYLDEIQDPANINGYMAGVFIGASSGSFGIHLEATAPLEEFSISNILYGDPLMEVIHQTQFNYSYLNTALMLRYELDLALIKPYVGAGINVGIPIIELIDGNATIDLTDFDFDQLAYTFSVGIVVLDFVDVDLRYISGTTDIVSGELLSDDPIYGEQLRLSFGLHIY